MQIFMRVIRISSASEAQFPKFNKYIAQMEPSPANCTDATAVFHP